MTIAKAVTVFWLYSSAPTARLTPGQQAGRQVTPTTLGLAQRTSGTTLPAPRYPPLTVKA